MSDSAVISDDGRYRYVLSRLLGFGGEGTCLFVMLNPSTADASRNDPTIRRCIRFGQHWGYSRLVVANLFALRATNPRVLRTASEPIGAELGGRINLNDEWLRQLSADPGLKRVIVAWGNLATQEQIDRAEQVIGILCGSFLPLKCLGVTGKGHPKHPLARGKHYVSYDDPPMEYDFEGARLMRQAARVMDRGVGP
jgi:hypothetical protein